MDIGIIGCGLIGHKRALAIRKLGGDRVVMACDVDPGAAGKLAGMAPGCRAVADWREVVACPGIQAVVVASIHSTLAEITGEALQAGKHVLVEKPAARSGLELEAIASRYQGGGYPGRPCCMVGFNLRFHPALMKAKAIYDSGEIGDLMFIRGRYGHGGRVGYEKEWRADPVLSGGGEMLDQGMHLVDLSRWFLGDFAKVAGTAKTYFWDMPVDDNAFMTLETSQGQIAHLHVSWTEWKNLFSLEIYGRVGKLHIDGLGGSYGVERIAHYQMSAEMGPPATVIYEFPGPDVSWEEEWKEFHAAIREGREPLGNLLDAYHAHQIIDQIYKENGHDYR